MTDDADNIHRPSRIQRRLIESSVRIEADDPEQIYYQHAVFCQTGLPYRNPGPDVREWERKNGRARLKVVAGEALSPETGDFAKLGLPYGIKPRLILTYLNREALIRQSPEIEVERSLWSFGTRVLGYPQSGPQLAALRDQMTRLAGALVRLGYLTDESAFTMNTQIIGGFDLWFPKDERRRFFWPSVVRLSDDYFNSLLKHAVPLDDRAIAALSHNAMALDAYAWIAYRCYRAYTKGTSVFIPWPDIHAQFGWGYERLRDFKRVFRQVLTRVHSQYRGARLELEVDGLLIKPSPPPVKGRITLVPTR